MMAGLYVVAGVIWNDGNEVLITQRPAHVEYAGYWEFPGGKVCAGESRRDALIREIHEEVGLEVIGAKPLIQVPHDRPPRPIVLDVWNIVSWRGKAIGREGQYLRWVPVGDLLQLTFPPPDYPVISLLQARISAPR